jgi:adenosine deaminase
MERPIDIAFTKALPKAELHAHLSGSIRRETLHEIWQGRQLKHQCLNLEDPMTAITPGGDGLVDVASFFPLFDKYIYRLCNDVEDVRYGTQSVLEDFKADGVRYLELRTTPRACAETGMTQEQYVQTVHETVVQWNERHYSAMEVYIILSVDRQMSASKAMEVALLAIRYQHKPGNDKYVVGMDLCGNPMKGDVTSFTPTFIMAREMGLAITVHFAEVLQSSTDSELNTILSWYPDRLGHCIHVTSHFQSLIQERKLGLELCLSCNVLAGLTVGGFETHHIRQWLSSDCPIALSTDDVGIFDSPLSNEYLLAAKHMQLSKAGVVRLARQAINAAFAGGERMMRLIDEFQKDNGIE